MLHNLVREQVEAAVRAVTDPAAFECGSGTGTRSVFSSTVARSSADVEGASPIRLVESDAAPHPRPVSMTDGAVQHDPSHLEDSASGLADSPGGGPDPGLAARDGLSATLAERFARAAWSCLAEPGDAVAGLLVTERHGKEIVYSLADHHIAHIVGDAITHASEPDRPAPISEPAD